MIPVTARLVIPSHEYEERFVRASGPGGQNVNKLSTAVELRFDVAHASLAAEVKARLTTLAGSRMTGDGVLVVDSREYRTQAQNREAAKARLVALVTEALVRPKARRPTKPGRGAKERRLQSKRQRGDVKAGRGRGGSGDD